MLPDDGLGNGALGAYMTGPTGTLLVVARIFFRGGTSSDVSDNAGWKRLPVVIASCSSVPVMPCFHSSSFIYYADPPKIQGRIV